MPHRESKGVRVRPCPYLTPAPGCDSVRLLQAWERAFWVRLWIVVTGILTSAMVFAACASEERASVEGDERTVTRTVVVTEADPLEETTRSDRRPPLRRNPS